MTNDKETKQTALAPDESFNRAIEWGLKEIRKEAVATRDDHYVSFMYQATEGAPSTEDQRRVLQFLEKEEAIKIARKKYPVFITEMTAEMMNIKPTGFLIDILQPKFNEVYTKMVGSLEQSPLSKINFDPQTSILRFGSTEIMVSKTKNSDPHYLLSILFRDIERDWAFDELWEDPYFRSKNPEYDPKTDWRKIYYAGYSVNEKVEKATTVKDFLNVSKTSVSINRKYLS